MFCILVAAGGSTLSAQSEADLPAQARRYLDAERVRQTEFATTEDIERVLDFLTDSAVYEHPRFGARIVGKEEIRQGMARFLGSTRAPQASIVGMLSNDGVVVIDLVQTFEARVDGKWIAQSRRGLKVLESEGDRIRRIIDYW